MSTAWIAAFVALALLVALLAFVQIGTLRRVIHTLERVDESVRLGAFYLGGLSAGEAIPSFDASLDDGKPMHSSELGDEPAVILFVSAACPPCRLIAAELREDAAAEHLGVELLLILNSHDELAELDVPDRYRVIYQRGGNVSAAFRIAGTPHAFAITDGVVAGSVIPSSLDDIRKLAERSLRKGVETRRRSHLAGQAM